MVLGDGAGKWVQVVPAGKAAEADRWVRAVLEDAADKWVLVGEWVPVGGAGRWVQVGLVEWAGVVDRWVLEAVQVARMAVGHTLAPEQLAAAVAEQPHSLREAAGTRILAWGVVAAG